LPQKFSLFLKKRIFFPFSSKLGFLGGVIRYMWDGFWGKWGEKLIFYIQNAMGIEMGKFFLDMRGIPAKVFLDDYASIDSESFVHKKYVFGCPNSSLESTPEGVQQALEHIITEQDDDAFFGVHIRETIRQLKTVFGKR